jgi:hypothetical protein
VIICFDGYSSKASSGSPWLDRDKQDQNKDSRQNPFVGVKPVISISIPTILGAK